MAEVLLLDDHLPMWMATVQPDFTTFKFIESPNFDSVNSDYFKIVFRPVNEKEWDTFYF